MWKTWFRSNDNWAKFLFIICILRHWWRSSICSAVHSAVVVGNDVKSSGASFYLFSLCTQIELQQSAHAFWNETKVYMVFTCWLHIDDIKGRSNNYQNIFLIIFAQRVEKTCYFSDTKLWSLSLEQFRESYENSELPWSHVKCLWLYRTRGSLGKIFESYFEFERFTVYFFTVSLWATEIIYEEAPHFARYHNKVYSMFRTVKYSESIYD